MFIIMGLPRSRTAWLSNFLSYDGLFCYHEGLNGCKTLKDYFLKLGKNIGDANTGLYQFNFEKYLFSNTKIIVIDNDVEPAIEYARQTYGTDITTDIIKWKKRLDNIKGLHIPFHDIDINLETIWTYVTDIPFDGERAEVLKGLNIQVKEPYEIDIESYEQLVESEGGKIF